MGSKRLMLKNGLGDLLQNEVYCCDRFIDLFCGGASVSWFAATELKKKVLSVDLQKYATVLSGAIVNRDFPLLYNEIYEEWIQKAIKVRETYLSWDEAKYIDDNNYESEKWSKESKKLSKKYETSDDQNLIMRCYGGYYFSPTQAITIDALINTIPSESNKKNICLASVIIAASRCAASPGHTAQPFKSTGNAGKYLHESWSKNPIDIVSKSIKEISPKYALHAGKSIIADANEITKKLLPSDLVFIDPPYSSVHYSRFYHVLETIARGKAGVISGIGRYPPPEERPKSHYSMKSKSKSAIEMLFKSISEKGSKCVVTFPKDNCSNGLSGDEVENYASKYFNVEKRVIKSVFSTLGGNKVHRAPRQLSNELILVLKP